MNIRKVRIRKLRITDVFQDVFFGGQGTSFISARRMIPHLILALSTVTPLQKVLRKFFPCFLVMWALVAVNEENQIIGRAWINAEKGRFNNGFSTFLGIGVKDGYQGMGIGTKLMEELIRWATMMGVKRINLVVAPIEERAIHLYTKFGFKKSGEVVKYYTRGQRYITMELHIDKAGQQNSQ